MLQVQDWLSLWTLNENDRRLDISNNRRPKFLAKYIPKFLRATAAFPEELLRCNFRGKEKKLRQYRECRNAYDVKELRADTTQKKKNNQPVRFQSID